MRFAALSGQKVRGHNLCWHESIPAWFEATATKDNARTLLTDHIRTVAGRYRGRIPSWDVVERSYQSQGRPRRRAAQVVVARSDRTRLCRTGLQDRRARPTLMRSSLTTITTSSSTRRSRKPSVPMCWRCCAASRRAAYRFTQWGIQSHLKADGPRPGRGTDSIPPRSAFDGPRSLRDRAGT